MADDRLISPERGFLIRKAPGADLFDFGQTIFFDEDKQHSPKVGTKVAQTPRLSKKTTFGP